MGIIHRPSAASVLELTDSIGLVANPAEKSHLWVKWTYASVHSHFEKYKGEYPLYVEGDERTMQDETDFAEIRIDGPFILQPSEGLFYLDIEVNVLIQSHMDPADIYKIHKAVGQFLPGFTNAICVYKFGDTELDDDSLAGTYALHTDLRETVDINHYGIVRDDTRLTQSTIEGHYRWEISHS